MDSESDQPGATEDSISPPVPADARFDFSRSERISFVEFKTPDEEKRGNAGATTVLDSALDTPEPALSPLIGEVVGNYLILSLLGHGGFGTVYKARDAKLQRNAAIKFLQYPREREFQRRFEREARVIANLSKHPNIVQIYSWGEHKGQSFFALEYLDCSSDALLKQHPDGIPLIRALEIGCDCARGLVHAHENHVLHRDIKPGNILLDNQTGQAKLCDFGLAISYGPGDERTTTVVAGSPAYMSPEQHAGETIDERSDIFSLGVTLYRLLSGQLPYRKASADGSRSGKGQREWVPLSEHRPDLSEGVLEIVERCCKTDPADRYQTAEQLLVDLEASLRLLRHNGTTGVSAGAKKRRRSGRRIAITSSVALVPLILFISTIYPGLGKWSKWMNPPIPEALVEVDELLTAGRIDDALFVLTAENRTNPSDDSRYLMAYATLLDGDIVGAEAAFRTLRSEKLREEGTLAVARWSPDEDGSRSESKADSAYSRLLRASMAIERGEEQLALDLLGRVSVDDLKWAWQRAELRQLTGVAQYRSGQFGAVSQVFAGGAGDIGSYYAELAGRQLDAARREELRAQIQHVREAIERIGATEPTDAERWTSRPVRLRISPSGAGKSRLAVTSGIVDTFPAMLADDLPASAPFPVDVVNREGIGDVLFEQELIQLSRKADALRVNQLLGATHMVESEFGRVFGEEFVRISFTDTETTVVASTKSIPFDRTTKPDEWMDTVTGTAWEVFQRTFPPRGQLTVRDGRATINIGKNLGIESGMEFRVFAGPAVERELEKVRARVTDNVSNGSAEVTLEGASPESVPEDGWFVQAVQKG